MSLADWPASVPYQPLIDGWGVPRLHEPNLSSAMNAGTTRQRQQFTLSVTPMAMSIVMTTEQKDAFFSFYVVDAANGTARFNMLVFNGWTYVSKVCAFDPQRPPRLGYHSFGRTRVDFDLLVESLLSPVPSEPPVDATPPTITSLNSASVNENSTLAHALTANEAVSWSIVGGADQAKFEISGSTLRWASNGSKDYEAPDDADTNNVYVVTVRATDTAANTTDQTISVTVANVSEGGGDVTPPTITSSNNVSVNENATLAHALTANEAVTWSIVGGADQAKFEISGSTLRWASNGTKDYESPDDADANNVYAVMVRATDGASNTSDQTISVTVQDLGEGGGATDIEWGSGNSIEWGTGNSIKWGT